MRLTRTETGIEKKKPSVAELVESLLSSSHIDVESKDNRLFIHIRGALAELPSLKNSKRISSNHAFIERRVLAKLKALDKLLAPYLPYVQPYTEPVSVILINSERSRSFDPDNTYQTVKDWLEPSTKTDGVRKKSNTRGWGVGLVTNDSLISGGSYHAKDVGAELSVTSIYLVPFVSVQSSLKAYIEEHCL